MQTNQSRLYQKLSNLLEVIYGADNARDLVKKIKPLITRFKVNRENNCRFRSQAEWLTEKSIFLITYADTIQAPGEKPLQTLHLFLKKYLKEIISHVHILPFYPYSSDDGFAVIDYSRINPDFGQWQDIHTLAEDFNLMFDAVINHISAQSPWFKAYLNDEQQYRDFFIALDPGLDFSRVTRPRALPLLTPFQTKKQLEYLWTTFSEDQIDLNYQNEKVLLTVIELLIFYLENGASALRLDAIGYLWKELGTECIHLKQTHLIIQVMRIIFDLAAPDTILVTETNVPHEQNMSYFGDGSNEAQMVYQFSLPPLVLHAYLSGNSQVLSKWAAKLKSISGRATYFNFLASHDGIGLLPLQGILEQDQITAICEQVQKQGGLISYKTNSDQSQSPYELNISYFDAIAGCEEIDELKVRKFMSSQAILLSMIGIPAIYIHSLLGSHNDLQAVKESGLKRRINRQKLEQKKLNKQLAEEQSLQRQIFESYLKLIQIRRQQAAFHALAEQLILFDHASAFILCRKSLDARQIIVAVYNLSRTVLPLKIDLRPLVCSVRQWTDLITDKTISIQKNHLNLELRAYQFMWLSGDNQP